MSEITYTPWLPRSPVQMMVERPGPPNMLTRTDGHGLLYQGRANVLYGWPESGKSWLAILACVEEMEAENHVIYFDFEADAATMVERLEALRVPEQLMESHLHYADSNQLDRPLTDEIWAEELLPFVAEHSPTLAVIDGVTVATALLGQDPKDDKGATELQTKIINRFLRYGITVLLIDHVPKNVADPEYAYGSQHKKAQVKGAQLLVKMVSQMGRGRHGALDVKATKDNAGHLRGIAGVGGNVANVSAYGHDDGTLTFKINPTPSGADAAEMSYLRIKDEILTTLANNAEQSFTRTELKKGYKGEREPRATQAINELVHEGKLIEVPTKRSPHPRVQINPDLQMEEPDPL